MFRQSWQARWQLNMAHVRNKASAWPKHSRRKRTESIEQVKSPHVIGRISKNQINGLVWDFVSDLAEVAEIKTVNRLPPGHRCGLLFLPLRSRFLLLQVTHDAVN
jgi:hypothetical protein